MSKKIKKRKLKTKGSNAYTEVRRIKEILHRKQSRTYRAASPIDVYSLKKNGELRNISTVYYECQKIPDLYNAIFPDLYPVKIQDLKKSEVRDFSIDGDHDKNIVWISLLIKDNADAINKFTIYEDEYERNYLKNDYDICEKILNELDEKVCISSWSLERRIILKQKKDGLKVQKNLANKYKNLTNRELPYVFSEISNKVEDKVSGQWFRREVDDALKRLVNDKGFLNYLKYKIIGINSVDTYYMTEVMLYETNSSIIDVYLSYVRSMQSLLSSAQYQCSINSIIKHRIGEVVSKINDSRLKKIAICVGLDVDVIDCVSAEVIELLDNYTRGDYKKCFYQSEVFLNKEPSNISIAEIYAKCCIREGLVSAFEGTVLGDIISSMHAILIRSDDLHASYNFLIKESLINNSLNYSYEIYSFVNKELSEVRDINDTSVNIGYLNARFITPLICNVIASNSIVIEMLNKLENYGSGETVSLYREYRISDDNNEQGIRSLDIPEYRKCKLIANKYFFKKDYVKAIQVYSDLMSLNDELSKVETLGQYAVSCIGIGNIEQGVKLIADSYIQKNELYLNLPFEYAVRNIDPFNWPTTIDIPILYFMYSEHSSKDKMEELRFSFEYYLKNNSIEKPSQLIDLRSDISDDKKLVFFLEKICVYDVMKRYTFLKGTNDVDKERINILNVLRLINPSSSDKYLKETKVFAQRIVVKEGVKSVGRSKIYVDTDNIKSSMTEEVCEIFDRYKELMINNIVDHHDEFITRIIDALGKAKGAGDMRILSLINSLQNNDSLVTWMVRRVFTEFLRGEYGLNNYLSSRIRHGTLLNTLSNPLLGENILTVKDEEHGGFVPNEYWLNRVNYSDKENIEALSNMFSTFSGQFYSFVEDIRNKKIQIEYSEKSASRGERNIEALFNFEIYEPDVQVIKRTIKPSTSYDEFMDSLFDYYWKLTEIKLVQIRDYFDNEASFRSKALFEQFSSELDKLPGCSGVTELKGALTKARINFNSSISEVSEWFNRSEAAEVNDFTVDAAIEVASKMICGFDDVKKFNLIEDMDETFSIKGRYLIYFVDIFYPLLDNVILRSKLPPELRNVTVFVNKNDEDILTIKIASDTVIIDDFESINLKLADKISMHMRDVSPQMLSQEGGTGFYKIIKAIKNGLNSEINVFDSKYIEKGKFVVEIKLNCQGLIV